ncbi:hypothetical protein B7494_g3288, partial [Chlorociboria aeruginascens]
PQMSLKLTLLDGGLGTTLADLYAYTFNINTPLWSSQLLLTSPSTLLSAQRAFSNAGAEIISTATYQGSYEGLSLSGVGSRAEAGHVLRSAIPIARAAVSGGRVALSLGAYGAVMVPSQEYSGRYDKAHSSREQLRSWHLERLQVFCGEETCWADIDFVAFETLPLVEEVWAVRGAMAGVEEGAKQKGFWISCVFPGEGNVLPDGSGVRDVVRAMLGEKEGLRRPMGVGVNCTRVGKVEALVEEMECAVGELLEGEGENPEWPALVLYPDGTNGEIYNTETKLWEVKEGMGSKKSWDAQTFDIMMRVEALNDIRTTDLVKKASAP